MKKSYIGEINCLNCGVSFTKRIFLKTKRHYCSMDCRKADKSSYQSEWTDERRKQQSIMSSGENNPNFNNKWSDERKQAFSLFKKDQFKNNPDYAHECGKSNRGKKFSKERIAAMHDHRPKESYQHFPSETTRKLIGTKSKEKWTNEYKEKHKKTMEELGYWVPLKDKDPYEIYYQNSNWINSMIEHFDERALDNLKKFGIFSQRNTKGWVRDHIVPRAVGFEFNLPPEIIRHPANLQFISHSENVKKGFFEKRLTIKEKESIISTLITQIENYSRPWAEQLICIEYIKGLK